MARSILDDLEDILPDVDRFNLIESRGDHAISATLYLFESIHNSFDEETASVLEKRFINAIRSKDKNKFIRTLKKIRSQKD